MSNEGKKFDGDKPDMSLLSSVAIQKVAAVMTFGKKKYDAHNWRKGIVYSRLLAAALRHIFSYLSGENLDPESGQSHLAHACCCLFMVLEFETTRIDLDDRYRSPSADKSPVDESRLTTAEGCHALAQESLDRYRNVKY